MHRLNRLTGALLAGVLLMSCDSAPGPTALGGIPPVVSAFTYSPQFVTVDPPSATTISVAMEVSVRATDADDRISAVRYVLQSPQAGAAAVATGTLRLQQGLYQATFDATLDAAQVGNYTMLVYAEDAAGNLSNQVRGIVNLSNEAGQPPVITEVALPERVTRPASGQPPVLIPIVATVTDPDGLNNILRVEMRSTAGGSALVLCDDGGGQPCGGFADSGDTDAGDGRYTITVQIESTNTPGSNTFVFTAIDRAGLTSDPVERTIVVE